MQLIPHINGRFERRAGSFMPKKNYTAAVVGFRPSVADFVLCRLAERLGVSFKQRQQGGAGADILLQKDPALQAEAYSAEITGECITLRAGSEAGARHALATLYQLLTNAAHSGEGLAACTFSDAPRYAHRGLMVDVARHYFEIAELEKIVDIMALCKMNVLHWHLTDDHAWRLESELFPHLAAVTAVQSPAKNTYTRQEVKNFVAYAAARGVAIIPEIDMPGHTTAALAAMPQLGCTGREVKLATGGGIYKTILCAGKDETLEFARRVVCEAAELFPAPYFHLGGDEAPKSEWQNCPACGARLRQQGLASFEDLQGWFTSQVAAVLKGMGKTVLCWNDALLADNLPEDITIQYWAEGGFKGYTYPKIAGRRMVVSEVFSNYFDYPHSVTPLDKTYHCTPKIGKRDISALPGLLGVEGAVWTEYIATPGQLQAHLFPRLFALAENGWSTEKDYACFLKRLPLALRELTFAGISCTPLEQATISGKERTRQAALHFKKLARVVAGDGMQLPLWQKIVMSAYFVGRFFTVKELPRAAFAFLQKAPVPQNGEQEEP